MEMNNTFLLNKMSLYAAGSFFRINLKIGGPIRERTTNPKMTSEIGRSKNPVKLPLEIVKALRNDCSIIPPKIKAKIKGAGGKFSSFRTYPITPKISSK